MRIRLYHTICIFIFLIGISASSFASVWNVGGGYSLKTIKEALLLSESGDTIIVNAGVYKEGNIIIDKPIQIWGINKPILDGELKYEVLSIKSNHVLVKGFVIQNSGKATMDDTGGIKIYDAKNVSIIENVLINNFFGIYLQYSSHCLIKDNIIKSNERLESQSGNGIHSWKSDSLQIIANRIEGHRDGIYFEFVTGSVIWRNIAKSNLRYGLHFMFSHDNAYFTNYFKHNGAGVAVMFTKKVVMMNNTFEENWGDAAYGVLFKELTDCYLSGNKFIKNTTGIYFDGSNRIFAEHNLFYRNGWGMRMQANCMDNKICYNNFIGNTFDIATNGTLTLNYFNGNYWDQYNGFDIDKDNLGDVPYRPLSLFAVIVEKNPPAMLLYRSFMVGLLDRSEKILPSLTPDNFIDEKPRVTPYDL